MTRIWERLYVGSLKDAEQLARSNPRHIASVVSLCKDQAIHRASKLTYMHIPIADARPISRQKFEDIMFAIALGVRRGNLLVHCLQGMNRSPVMIAAWMDRCGYAEIEKALSEIAELRDLAPSPTLLASVQGYLRKNGEIPEHRRGHPRSRPWSRSETYFIMRRPRRGRKVPQGEISCQLMLSSTPTLCTSSIADGFPADG